MMQCGLESVSMKVKQPSTLLHIHGHRCPRPVFDLAAVVSEPLVEIGVGVRFMPSG